MNAEQLRALQTPLKQQYKDDPDSACQTLSATGTLSGEDIACVVGTFAGDAPAGLHPATGGDGSFACSGDMLLESLVGCAGVTLRAVATAMEIPIRGGTVSAEGDMDFRGTLGVDREAPVGITNIRLHFNLDTDAPQEKIDKLIQLTERYCVVYQTLASPPRISVSHQCENT